LEFLGESKQAVSVLENELKQPGQTEDVLQFALKVLDSFGPESQTALETVKALCESRKNSKYIARIGKRFIEKYQK